jgi:hypothetical protein
MTVAIPLSFHVRVQKVATAFSGKGGHVAVLHFRGGSVVAQKQLPTCATAIRDDLTRESRVGRGDRVKLNVGITLGESGGGFCRDVLQQRDFFAIRSKAGLS